MCNSVIVSTNSPEDLSTLPGDRCRFETLTPGDEALAVSFLEHPHRWFVTGRHGGCSCHLRHLAFAEDADVPAFGEPEEWMEEDPENVEDTGTAYDVLARLVSEGHQVDLVDLWDNEVDNGVKTLTVKLSEVSRSQFRFFEKYRFVLVT